MLSGIAEHYEPETLIGRTLVLLANLPPRKIRGIESEGMLLSAASDDESTLRLLFVDEGVGDGAGIA